jgi:ubiquinone/menaquinone biosynthesis C-methylase UbiE
MTQLVKPIATPPNDTTVPVADLARADSLFERFDWIYILCRENFFRDDTRRMIAAFWPKSRPQANARLVELGCGPGFYSRNLARAFPEIEVLGLDRSRQQLEYAREKAATSGLNNCRFERGDVLDVSRPEESFDYLIASRLFTVLAEPERAVAEMFRVLKGGGRCFVAEPRFKFWASIPLFIMRVVASASAQACREPSTVAVFSAERFERLFRTAPWEQVRIWQDGRYQYALCQKG